MNSEYLKKLHDDILLIMDEIDRVCQQNNLKYYLIGGTLLGAVRHKGFIPWDDDLDIVMPREDMEKLIEISAEALSPGFHLEWITTNNNYWCIFPKICLDHTVFDEGKMQKGVKPIGIFVDIFPLDKTGGYQPELDVIKKRLKRYHYLSSCRISNGEALKTRLYRFLSHFISNKNCYKLQRQTCVAASKHGESNYTNFGSQYSVRKQTMPITWYGNGVYMQFEDRMYNCPTEYEKVLESIFGSNYMQLPPLEKRRSHYPKKVVFKDGMCMEFEDPEYIVTIDEQ